LADLEAPTRHCNYLQEFAGAKQACQSGILDGFAAPFAALVASWWSNFATPRWIEASQLGQFAIFWVDYDWVICSTFHQRPDRMTQSAEPDREGETHDH
jgi:hypothetical protein